MLFFEFLKIVWEFYVMFVNVDMRGTVVLITSESTDYFSAAVFIELLKFWCEYLLLFSMHARVLATNCGKEVGRGGRGDGGDKFKARPFLYCKFERGIKESNVSSSC